MNDTLEIEPPTCGSIEHFGVRTAVIAGNLDDASGRLSTDWEHWKGRVQGWRQHAGEEDCDGIVWPTTKAIQAALQLIQQMQTEDFAEPTDLVPSGDGGIVFSFRTGTNRQEIEISESGEAELLLFDDGRLIDRKPW